MSSDKPRVVVPSPRAVAVREIQLIDRTEEMKVLRTAADRATQGEGGAIFLHGEAGIGKTRLARELEAYARSRGMQVLSGRCPALFRMDGVPPYVLWEEVIRDYVETCTPEQLFRVIGSYPIEVSKLVPELKNKLRTFPQSFPLSPEDSRDRLFEAVAQFITNISKETPLLVILDDLQWTDKSSLLLMHYLARGVDKDSLLILGAYRDTYVDKKHPLSPVLTELNRERLLQSVSLKRMSFDDVLEMIKRILEQDDVSREFCKLVYEKTRGNPFFVEEVTKSLKEDGVIYRDRNTWKIREVSTIEFPGTVKDVIKARISRLDDECQRVLTLASFVGKDFTFEALHGVTAVEEDELLDLMEKMLETGMIKEQEIRGEAVYSFADIIVRDVVYEEVSLLRRKRLHRVAGNALEKVYAEKIDEHFGELAYHFLEGGDKEKALEYFLKAGEKAQKVYAYAEAFSYLQQAIELIDEGDLEERVHIMEKLGDLKWWMGEVEIGMDYWIESLTLWNQLKDKKNVAKLHSKMASTSWMWAADKEKASEHHNKALEILEKEPHSVELASLYEDISHMLWRTGEPPTKALPWAKKALELAKRLGTSEVLAGCYNDLGVSSLKSGNFKEATKYLEKGLKIALDSNFMAHALTLYNNLSENYYMSGKFQKAFETAQEGSKLAKKVGALGSFSWISGSLAYYHISKGELQEAISILEELLSLDKKARFNAHIPYVMWGLGESYYWLGEWDKSLHLLLDAYDLAKKTGEYQAASMTTVSLGALFSEQEDYIEAEHYLNEGNGISEKAGEIDFQHVWLFPQLSKLYLIKREIEKAQALIGEIFKYTIKRKNKANISYAEMLKAMLAREQKRWKQSIQHFQKSLQGYKTVDAQKWAISKFAELLYEYGLMYLSRNEEGDKENAYALHSQALEAYKRMGAKRKIEKVKSKMMQIDQPERKMPADPELVVTEIPKMALPTHITTGYEELDDLLIGGISRNHAVILTSPSCDERDLLIKRFLEAGVKNGEITFYVTTDPGEVKSLTDRSNFYLFICNPQADRITKDMPNVFKLKGVENLTDINIALTSAFRNLDKSLKGSRRICVEVISDILLQHHAVQTRRWLTGLLTELKSRGFTTLAVIDPEIHPQQELRAIVGIFEGEISINKRGTEKLLKIEKMTNQKYLKSELPLEKEKLQSNAD